MKGRVRAEGVATVLSAVIALCGCSSASGPGPVASPGTGTGTGTGSVAAVTATGSLPSPDAAPSPSLVQATLPASPSPLSGPASAVASPVGGAALADRVAAAVNARRTVQLTTVAREVTLFGVKLQPTTATVALSFTANRLRSTTTAAPTSLVAMLDGVSPGTGFGLAAVRTASILRTGVPGGAAAR